MLERAGSIWSFKADCIVIPVNWTVNRNGLAIMGAGVAKQAALRWPWLPERLGAAIRQWPDKPRSWWVGTVGIDTVAFPTKYHWRDPSDLSLIEQSAHELAKLARMHRWGVVVLPRVGCGLGGLQWDDVRAVLALILDDRFYVLTPD